ncbi:unnamed protein product [Medioppia subpectinata]|uniref:Uncharacterized protein n=1 Tax=Medioppia subpectinata TaxID=1979941 RepID=A0A7R9Q0X3_9ACAR|nr:unnamed protein product [Medioppia subpectinata]CAG2108439.1 unnamed protein product [Medioppia subpectinata]
MPLQYCSDDDYNDIDSNLRIREMLCVYYVQSVPKHLNDASNKCLADNNNAIVKCQIESIPKDISPYSIKEYSCCGSYTALSCARNIAKKKCTAKDYDQVYEVIRQTRNNIYSTCKDYQRCNRSTTLGFSIPLIAIMFLVI